MDYNNLFNRKFKGCPLLGTMEDVARERTLKIYYIDDPLHVGVFDGVDTWVSPVKGCFHYLKEGLLDSQILLAQQGKIAAEVADEKGLYHGSKKLKEKHSRGDRCDSNKA